MDEFLSRMQSLLGGEYEEFLKYYSSGTYRGLRVNTLKCSPEKLISLLGELKPTPFCREGFYLPEDLSSPGNSPLHHCGAFYVQEPSASSAVEMLGVQPGELVLDLCAAPGGKSTQIGAKLNGRGLLWSNEVVRNRANILLSNIERIGIHNAVVSNAYPEVLCERLSGFFDRVLVDAPCSGEGMFRKNDAHSHWSVEHVKSCAERQLNILRSAQAALKPGGVMVYSTCTFSPEENEGVITRFLEEFPNFTLEDSGVSFGRPAMEHARRIFPMDGGEGHFAARLRKSGEHAEAFPNYSRAKAGKAESEAFAFYDSVFKGRPFGERLEIMKDKVIILPENYPSDTGVPVLRAGVLIAEIKNRRFEPCHSAFTAAKPEQCVSCQDFDFRSTEIRAYLHGEEISVPPDLKGYTAVCVNGMTAGFGKASNGRLKNKYPKGLRTLK